MKPEEVFKRYDIRGEYPEEINEEFAERLGKALGTFAERNYGGKVVVGKDNKESSRELKEALIDGLSTAGAEVLDAGTGTTDYVAFTGTRHEAVSVQVTSSHLPLDTNGFKFMYPEGNGFVNEDLFEVQDLFRDEDFETGSGEVKDVDRGAYRREMKSYFRRYFDSIDRKVVVETLGGAANGTLQELLEELGAEVVDLSRGQEPYIDPPNPKPGLMGHVEERVEKENADIALATDMDADRVALYFRGEWVSGDDLFALFARMVSGDVVASVDTSPAVEDIVEERGDSIYYTRVGDPFVVSRMIEEDAALSGEPNGHYCFPGFVNYNSGTLAALLLAGMDLETGLEELPEYYTERRSVEVDEKDEVMETVREHSRERHEVISEMDGVKFRESSVTVLVRPSGSSPVIRVVAQSRDQEEAEKVAGSVEEFIRNR